jgi:hypothetical protein
LEGIDMGSYAFWNRKWTNLLKNSQ